MHSRGAEEEGDSARRDMDFLVKVVEINDNSRIEQSSKDVEEEKVEKI
jgi:hypothetical protein